MNALRLAVALTACLAAPATGQNLTIATGGSITSLDPHFFNAAPNNAIAEHIFGRLVDRDAQARIRPDLAESWRVVSDTEWEFKLRRDVTWHDGKPFTADDVLFTLQRAPNVPNSPGGFGATLRSVKSASAPDPYTLRIVTHWPNPVLLPELASVFIVSRHVGDGATTEDYNAGRAAIGTGPYRVANHRMGDRTELARNDQYWGGAQPWQRVSYRFIATDPARTAALLAGDVDLIDQVAPADLPRLRRDRRVTISEIQSLRLAHLGPDYSRPGPLPFVTDNEGRPLAANPFLDVRVRRALNMAINRDALAERAMDGLAAPAAQWLPQGAYSHDPQTRPPAYDPEGAKRLLAEAGFPNGFRMTLHTMNDRFPNDARLSQAVAQMWSRIGVQTAVEALPWSSYSGRAARQEFSMSLGSWGSTTGEGLSFAKSVLATFDRQRRTGSANHRRYSSAEFDALLQQAETIMDEERREQAIFALVRFSAQQVPMFPLVHLTNVWALKRTLSHEPRMDERTLAMGVRPAQ
ncbi:ABC transporter substrate-binding protein [Roseomonas sp. AR75]|jgi:peptide/nickel transport system substrate-binding protein|uniref:ABC transporter substrate-binding protein n=1 Tax=Roseomonas sp. AR75 TaxID=2562311 RepID=UPI0010C130FE|nr:ABC transporter substrate-binding protein [Roseomonas sp. AR75]